MVDKRWNNIIWSEAVLESAGLLQAAGKEWQCRGMAPGRTLQKVGTIHVSHRMTIADLVSARYWQQFLEFLGVSTLWLAPLYGNILCVVAKVS